MKCEITIQVYLINLIKNFLMAVHATEAYSGNEQNKID